MNDPESRFRQSLHQIDELRCPVAPIDAGEIRRLAAGTRRRRVPIVAVVAAAAALVAIAGVGVFVARQARPATVAATPAPVSTSARPSSSPSTSIPSTPSAPAGFTWVDAELGEDFPVVWVAVPVSWGRGESWDADYCFAETRPEIPEGPYVDANHGTSQGHAITCPDLTAQQQQPHVSVAVTDLVVGGFPWDGNTPGWKQWSTTVDGIAVTVTAPVSQEQLARQILDNVRVVAR
ncbi:MAG: hypothetical protein LCH96_02575 [Actinobacteria bacterium]|nr:hypothetical protein [Actinomycetota bacterium]